jgi:hypothetical protein
MIDVTRGTRRSRRSDELSLVTVVDEERGEVGGNAGASGGDRQGRQGGCEKHRAEGEQGEDRDVIPLVSSLQVDEPLRQRRVVSVQGSLEFVDFPNELIVVHWSPP